MKRRDVFAYLSEQWDVRQELDKIYMLMDSALIVDPSRIISPRADKLTICEFIDTYSFHTWKQRNRYLSSKDMLNKLGWPNSSNEEELLYYLELVNTFVWLCETALRGINPCKEFCILRDNVRLLIDHLGYKIVVQASEQKTILVEKNLTANVVAEIVSPDLVTVIFEYTHFALKGKPEEKKQILRTIAHKLEPKRAELEKANKTLSDDLFSLFNNLDIRHNNVAEGTSSYSAHIASLSPKELEHWYDETYQTALLAFLELDHIPRADRIKDLRMTLKGKPK
jgi:hypothetical protein